MAEEEVLELNATKRLNALKDKVITARTLQQNKIIKTASDCKEFFIPATKHRLGSSSQRTRNNSMHFVEK